ncbi:MAG TPA: ABC transporter ATP-binding protein [Dehalococcoidia bacterium]|nr:ABC transporter ATP-binding protein [Dehalococcoidia bacterium]
MAENATIAAPAQAQRVDGSGAAAPTIVLRDVSKWYGDKVALSGVNFEVRPGVSALLGPNGAGKSTALKLITGQLRPSRGEVRVLDQPVVNNPRLYRRIGLVPEQEALYPFMTAREFVEFAGRLHSLPDPRAAAETALGHVKMLEAADRRLGGFSKGMRQRVKIAQALVHEPELLILDEPLTGADPRQRVELIELFHDLAARGATVFISSHVLNEVERMGSNVLVLVDGKLAAEGDFRRIRDLMNDRPRRLRVLCDQPRDIAARLVHLPGTCELKLVDGGLELQTDDARTLALALPRMAQAAAAHLYAVEPLDEGLESVFRYLVQ